VSGRHGPSRARRNLGHVGAVEKSSAEARRGRRRCAPLVLGKAVLRKLRPRVTPPLPRPGPPRRTHLEAARPGRRPASAGSTIGRCVAVVVVGAAWSGSA
jgi:hypothetical protein